MSDITVEDHGSLYLFRAETEPVTEWIKENVETEPWMWFAGGLCVDHHSAAGLAGVLIENGFSIGDTEDRNHHH